MRLQQQHGRYGGLFFALCASIREWVTQVTQRIGEWVIEPITERVGERVTEPAFFTIVEQSAVTAPADLSASTADFGFRRVVHGHRDRLQRQPQLEQRVCTLQPAAYRRDGPRRWLLLELRDGQLRVRTDLPEWPATGRVDHCYGRRCHMYHK